jgi:cytochrome c553
MKYIVIISVMFLFLGCFGEPVDAQALYKENCSNCHGKFARKSAFGKSQVISGFTKEEIKNAIIGYQEETYGGSMRTLMRKEVSSLNEEEIDALSLYISTIND